MSAPGAGNRAFPRHAPLRGDSLFVADLTLIKRRAFFSRDFDHSRLRVAFIHEATTAFQR